MTLSQRTSHRTDISCGWWSIRSRFDLIPKSIEITSGCMVVSEVVAGMCDPERSNWNISLKHSPRFHRTYRQIILQNILSLYPIFNEIIMPLNSIPYIMLNSQEVNPVQRDNSSHRMMNCISSGIRFSNISIHMEVNAIPADNSRLPTVSKLGVCNMTHQTILGTSRHKQMRSIPFSNRCFISHHFDVSGQ